MSCRRAAFGLACSSENVKLHGRGGLLVRQRAESCRPVEGMSSSRPIIMHAGTACTATWSGTQQAQMARCRSSSDGEPNKDASAKTSIAAVCVIIINPRLGSHRGSVDFSTSTISCCCVSTIIPKDSLSRKGLLLTKSRFFLSWSSGKLTKCPVGARRLMCRSPALTDIWLTSATRRSFSTSTEHRGFSCRSLTWMSVRASVALQRVTSRYERSGNRPLPQSVADLIQALTS